MKINKYTKLKVFFAFLFIILMPFNTSLAREIPEPNNKYYIDEMNILSEGTKNLISNQDLKDGSQIFVLTLKNLDEDPFDFAVRSFKEYKLGDEEIENGLLIQLSENSNGKKDIQVITGYGLEGILPDGKVGRIIDEYMIPYFEEGDLDKGIREGFKVFYKEIDNSEPIDQDKILRDKQKEFLIKLVIVIVVIFIRFYLAYKFGITGSSGYYSSSSSSSFGGFSSGGFSGGGGSTGGGGARRSF